MSFKDLPRDWPGIPLTDSTHIADVLDLFVNQQARMDGALCILVCDPLRRPIQPIQLDGIQSAPPPDARRVLSQVAGTIEELAPGGCLLFARARRGGLSITADDQRWRQCVEESFTRMPIIGFHVITPDGSRVVHDMEAAA